MFIHQPNKLLDETGVVVTVMMMVMMGMNNHHNLRLRRVRYREAEDKNQSEQNLLHASVSLALTQRAEQL